MKSNLTLSVGWVGGWLVGWVIGDLDIKAILNSSWSWSWSWSWAWQLGYQEASWVQSVPGVFFVSVSFLDGVWKVFGSCLRSVYGVWRWCLDSGQVKSGQVKAGQFKTVQVRTGQYLQFATLLICNTCTLQHRHENNSVRFRRQVEWFLGLCSARKSWNYLYHWS